MKSLTRPINIDDPQLVFKEVKTILYGMFLDFDFKQLAKAFEDIKKLFNGQYYGYQKCNTRYHDIKHTTNTFLATARLIHGAMLQGKIFFEKNVNLGLISALFHDTGYIQTSDDTNGTGAKYSLSHIGRSTDFMEKYFTENGYTKEEFKICRDIIKCTDLQIKIQDIKFESDETKMIGQMVGTADILGQMADRAYLEKLQFLFIEFKEGKVGSYKSELDLFEKTICYYENIKHRLTYELGSVNSYMKSHFKQRLGINRNIYEDYIKKNIKYLKKILKYNRYNYHSMLRRWETKTENDMDSITVEASICYFNTNRHFINSILTLFW